MAHAHPDLEAEQAYIDHAYACLEATREAAARMSGLVEVGRGGTNQAKFERDVIWETMAARLSQLDLHQQTALCFGRIDVGDDHPAVAGNGNGNGNGNGHADGTGHADADGNGHADGNGNGGGAGPRIADSFYIGRIAVSDDQQEPVIVDWRAPIAEPFYRATGRIPMGLVRRRHFATRGRTVLGIEDELFGDAVASLGLAADDRPEGVTGYGALISALETARTGRLTDIVATIQGEQDEIIRSPLPGVLVVQGGPGTGKTVVALHRAAYLLYTHRFPLEGQGVLVVGPNRLFLSYIEQVLPSLGEAGVELAVLSDLVGEVRFGGRDTGLTARVKGDLRMAKFLRRAVRQRQQYLREDLVVPYGLQRLRLTREQSRQIVEQARRRFRKHNGARRFVEGEVYAALARSARGEPLPVHQVRERLRGLPEVRQALEWMWPVLTPAQLLNDFFSGRSLLRNAADNLLTDAEWQSLHRPRIHDPAELDAWLWPQDDAPLLDEARALLGAKPRSKKHRSVERAEGVPGDDEVRTYGHICVDEAQDLSPMQLRVLNRRSLNGSMTIVGDIAQSTGQWAHHNWDEILEHLPDRHAPRRAELTIGYRTPAPLMELATRVLRVAAPELTPPTAVRQSGDEPIVTDVAGGSLADEVCAAVRRELDAVDPGSVAVVCTDSLVAPLSAALDRAGIDHGQANRHGLEQRVTLVPVGLAKGLELDACIVVEPAAVVDEEAQGMRALYVALTRATKRLSVVHERPLPAALVGEPVSAP